MEIKEGMYNNNMSILKDIQRCLFTLHVGSCYRVYKLFTDIGSQYQKEYQKAVDSCGDYTRYTNVESYENLINIKDEILQKITSCQSVNITTPGKFCFISCHIVISVDSKSVFHISLCYLNCNKYTLFLPI